MVERAYTLKVEKEIQKEVKRHSNGLGYVYLPKDWIGETVIILVEAKEK